jgi:hypothetical protein
VLPSFFEPASPLLEPLDPLDPLDPLEPLEPLELLLAPPLPEAPLEEPGSPLDEPSAGESEPPHAAPVSANEREQAAATIAERAGAFMARDWCMRLLQGQGRNAPKCALSRCASKIAVRSSTPEPKVGNNAAMDALCPATSAHARARGG